MQQIILFHTDLSYDAMQLKFAPFKNMKLVPCLLCGKKWVPENILSSVEPPSRLPVRGAGVFIQARVCRARPKSSGESDALAVR